MMTRLAAVPTPYRSTEAALAGLGAGKFPRGHLLAFQTSKKWTQGLWKKYFHVKHSTASRSLDHLTKLGLIWRGRRIRLEGTPGASYIYYLSSLGGRVLQRITTNRPGFRLYLYIGIGYVVCLIIFECLQMNPHVRIA